MSENPQTSAEPEKNREKLGRLVFGAGGLLVPLGIGAAIGYWVADREVRWVPSMLGSLLLLWIVGLAAMIAGAYMAGPAAGKRRNRKRIALLTLLVVIAAAARIAVHVIDRPAPLTQMGKRYFERTFRDDVELYREQDGGLQRVLATLRDQGSLFSREGEPRLPTAREERVVVDAWETFVNTSFALDQIRAFYEDFFRFDLSRVEREAHLKSYLLTFAAELSLFENATTILELIDRNPHVEKLLDVERPDRHLPAGTLTAARDQLAGLTDLTRVIAGERYLDYLDELHDARSEAFAGGYGFLWNEVERHLAAIEPRSKADLSAVAIRADFSPIKRSVVKDISFPVQRGVAEWMGKTRVKRAGRYLITQEQLDAMAKTLQPGDVLLGRKNWYLSNVGLPGFWPHALLWTGTTDDMAAAFDADPSTLAWVQEVTGEPLTFSQMMDRRYPGAWRKHALSATTDEPIVIIEAVSAGVVQHTFAKASGDYMAALRPRRLDALARAQAIERAFSFVGRPYDFDFDFATDHALVCTELVYRSYRPAPGKAGLDLQPIEVMGRLTLPAHEIARLHAATHEDDDRPFDLVYFIDGRESDGAAVVADEDAFVGTADRSKWDVAQD